MGFFEIGSSPSLFDDNLNKGIMQRIAKECYLPTNNLLLKLIQQNPSIKVAFSISGVTLEQFEEYAPAVLDSFRALAATGCVEFLGETYFHSLACMMPDHEFEIQVLKHVEALQKYFNVRPSFFRNTELIYSDEVGRRVSRLGFDGIFTDGIPHVLNSRSAHQVYLHPTEPGLKILLRNYQLSDDIAFRFSQPGNPLTADRYVEWLEAMPSSENVVNIALDYETFGEHQKKETGIFNFLESLLIKLSNHPKYKLATPSEAIKLSKSHGALSVMNYISWADQERDLSAWLGNEMQRDAFDTLLKLEPNIKALADVTILKLWRYLQTSDHLYYMSTKNGTDGGVHSYFSPYPSPYEAFMNYMNILSDFTLQVNVRKAIFKRKKTTSRAAIKNEKVNQNTLETVVA